MNLKDFYFNHITPEEYHYKFFESISDIDIACRNSEDVYAVNNHEFEVYDEEDAVLKFRELCLPDVRFDDEKRCWFYLLSYFLCSMGYEIKEFPRLLARPPMDPMKFTYDDIRNRIIANGDDDNGIVRYATRRVFVANMTFDVKSSHIGVGEQIDQKFREISNRSASFDSMSLDEKLAEISNLIENLLKQDKNFTILDYSSVCFDYISDEMITNYRKRLHCFRHSSADSLLERNNYTDQQKNFFVDYGLTIIKVIHAIICETSCQ